MLPQIRIGIDVGGTFTHGVAISVPDLEVVSIAKVPTTHKAANGVAQGIIETLEHLLASGAFLGEAVTCIAHSTTQATNALLEGDVCPVGIFSVGSGLEGRLVKSGTQIDPIEVGPNKTIPIYHHYEAVGSPSDLTDSVIRTGIKTLMGAGAEAIVAAAAFSVDDPTVENLILDVAASIGIPATATHEISLLYGLSPRTRTAVINAAIMPKMLHAATMTQAAAKSLGLNAPLVVMRSDGGAMDIEDMKRRPILTMLSGPAAGVAAALMVAQVSDGLFVEVGGTSTDVSLIRDGYPTIKPARIGAHQLHLNTIDVRTVGVAGGSVIGLDASGAVKKVGPRSAHIAGLGYSAFTKTDTLSESVDLTTECYPGLTTPAIATQSELPCTFTPTCAANLLGYIPKGDVAAGNLNTIQAFLDRLKTSFSALSPTVFAQQVLSVGAGSILEIIYSFTKEHPERKWPLIGGGGGASVWVGYLAEKLDVPFTISPHAPVISAIGAALALLQETIEKTVIDPSPQDFINIRQLAEGALLKAGASSDSIEVKVELDANRGVLRATAYGSFPLVQTGGEWSTAALAEKAKIMMRLDSEPAVAAKTQKFTLFQAEKTQKKWWGLAQNISHPWVVLDQKGRPRFSGENGNITGVTADEWMVRLQEIVSPHLIYGEAQAIVPPVFIVTDTRTMDLSGLSGMDQLTALCEDEKKRLHPNEPIVIVVRL